MPFLLHLAVLLIVEKQVWSLPMLSVRNGFTNHELSGPQCSAPLTFGCNAKNFNNTDIFWFAGSTVLVAYSFRSSDPFPVSLQSDVINGTAQIENAYYNGSFNYIDFTLTVNVKYLVPFQEQNISCGSLYTRSNAFKVKNFNAIDHCRLEFPVNLTAIYSRQSKKLTKIVARWINVITTFREINYFLQLRGSKGILWSTQISNRKCSERLCIFEIEVQRHTSQHYYLTIEYTENRIHYSFTSNILKKFYEENDAVKIPKEECNWISLCLNNHCWISWGFISSYRNFTNYTWIPLRNLEVVSSLEVIPELNYIEFADYYENKSVIKIYQGIEINATYSATYWNNGRLTEIQVLWSVSEVYGCMLYNSTIWLQSDEGAVLNVSTLDIRMCSNQLCRYSFFPNQSDIDYMVYIQNSYISGFLYTNSNIIVGSSLRTSFLYEVSHDMCSTYIQCIMADNGCTVVLGKYSIYDNHMEPNVTSDFVQDSVSYRLNPSSLYYIQVSSIVNSIVVNLRGNFITNSPPPRLDDSNSIYLIISRALFVAIAIIPFCIYYCTKKKKFSHLCHRIWFITVCVMTATSCIHWLLVGTLIGIYSDTCNTSVYQTRDAILKLASGITDIALIAILFGIILTEYLLNQGCSLLSKIKVHQTNAKRAELHLKEEETIEMEVNEVYRLRSNIASKNVQSSLQKITSIYEKCV